MRKTDKIKLVAAIFAVCSFTMPADAQYFATSPSSQTKQLQKNTPQPQSAANASSAETVKKDDRYSAVELTDEKIEKELEKKPVTSPFDYAYGKQEPKKPAKEQKQFRRYSTVGGVTVETTEKNPEDELIMLYMKNFSIYRSPSGQVRCSARFAVLTTLPMRLSNISYRLKWPQMETMLTFNDVDPGVENHFDYALLGDGCYTMDKQPNIVVNRCRAKGLTQRQCASKIRWIKEI